MTNLKFLVAAYMVIWAVFFAYLFFLHRRLSKAEATVRELQEPDPPS